MAKLGKSLGISQIILPEASKIRTDSLKFRTDYGNFRTDSLKFRIGQGKFRKDSLKFRMGQGKFRKDSLAFRKEIPVIRTELQRIRTDFIGFSIEI